MKQTKPYNLKRINSENYLVISKDYIRFDEMLPQLTNDLKGKQVKGNVVLDMLLTNGNNSSRFLKVFFDGNSFILATLKKIALPDTIFLSKIKIIS